MNKYQEYILKSLSIGKNFIFSQCCSIESENTKASEECGTFDKTSDSFNITQDEDITHTRYALIVDTKIASVNPINGVFARRGEQWKEIPCENNRYRIVVDFNERTDAIKFTFTNKLADDYILKITYTEADKEKYYAKLEQERKENLLKAADIKVATGDSLVNIYFQPCCDKYDHTEIKLFVPKDYVTVGGPYGPVQKPSSWAVIKKCDVSTEDFYKSISDLAYGKYAFILKQFDKDNQLLLETDYIIFSIDQPIEEPEFGHVNFI